MEGVCGLETNSGVPYNGYSTVGAELNLHKASGSMLIYAMGGPKTKLNI